MQRKWGFFLQLCRRPFIPLKWDFCTPTPLQATLGACQGSPFERGPSPAAGPRHPSAVRWRCRKALGLTQPAKLPPEILPGARTCCRVSWRETGLLAARKSSSKRLCSRGGREMRDLLQSHKAGRGTTEAACRPASHQAESAAPVRCVQQISTFATSQVELVGLKLCKLGAFC